MLIQNSTEHRANTEYDRSLCLYKIVQTIVLIQNSTEHRAIKYRIVQTIVLIQNRTEHRANTE